MPSVFYKLAAIPFILLGMLMLADMNLVPPRVLDDVVNSKFLRDNSCEGRRARGESRRRCRMSDSASPIVRFRGGRNVELPEAIYDLIRPGDRLIVARSRGLDAIQFVKIIRVGTADNLVRHDASTTFTAIGALLLLPVALFFFRSRKMANSPVAVQPNRQRKPYWQIVALLGVFALVAVLADVVVLAKMIKP